MQLASPLAKKKSRIEIIPLIDIIIFLLATFVMVSLSMVKQRGLNVQLPSASTARPENAPEPDATLTVAADGTYYFNKEKLSLETIRERLRALAVQHPDARLSINGDADSRLEATINLLDASRAVGLTRVLFQTKPTTVHP